MKQSTKVIVFVAGVGVVAILLWGHKGIFALLPFPSGGRGVFD